MADLKALSGEMEKLKRQLETVLYISGYRDYDDLSGLDDYKQIKTADERQKLEEYRNILYKLDEVQGNLAYFDKPVKEVSTLHMNASGRYETVKGHCYTSGSGIEFCVPRKSITMIRINGKMPGYGLVAGLRARTENITLSAIPM